MKLYGAPQSGSAAIEMALRAIGLPYETVRAATWEPGPGLEALKRLNPLGQVPTLVLDDGTVVSESVAILLHLALAHPQAALLPAGPSERAVALRALVFVAANCYSAVSVSDYPERWTASRSASARAQVRQAARAQLHQAWEHFARLFGTPGPLWLQPQPGALAFLAVVVSQWSGARAHLAAVAPEFHQRLLSLEDHPRLQAVLREHRGTTP